MERKMNDKGNLPYEEGEIKSMALRTLPEMGETGNGGKLRDRCLK
jgi:hypothetical protein